MQMRWTFVRVVLLISLCGAVPAPKTVEEIEDCMRENLPKETSQQKVVFKAQDRTGAIEESRATIYWKKFPNGLSKVLLRVSAPPKLRGTGLLMIEKEKNTDRFLYLPELGKVRRITKNSSSGALLGTDFTYNQLEQIQGLHEERETERLDDAMVSERPVYVLQSRPSSDDESFEYERILTFVDHANCVVLRQEFYERGDRLRKVLSIDPNQISRESELYVPRRMLMQDLLEKSSTELILKEIEIGKRIPDRTFSRKELAVGRR